MNPPDGDAVYAYRLDEVERDVGSLMNHNLPVRMNTQEENTRELKKSIDRLTTAVTGFALTVAAAAVTVVLTLLNK